ncbi:YybS family protein [Neobacillus novalis]|uniref:YybS family protein n=1 Tax=Neobacillus novalis TaxID=220687 RepID=A0AA95SCN7_9BACI|nr:YybS family protein [Neobacillus novalis]WHY86338.1 YybS family protein [Neobacillus novalis]
MKNVRKLTEGAILLTVFTVLLLITIYIPPVGAFLNLVLPLLFMLFSAKNQPKNIVAFFLAAIFLSFLAGSFLGLGLMLLYGTIGVVIGFMLQKNKSRTSILILNSLIFMAGLVIYYVISVAFLKLNIIQELTVALNDAVKNSQDMLTAMGKEDQIELLKKQNADFIKMVGTLVPYFLIMMSIIVVFIIQWVNFPILKRFGVNVQPWGSFRNLSLPRSLLWYYLIVIGVDALAHPDQGTYLYTVVINARYILEMFLIFQGLAFVLYIFYQKSVSKGFNALVVILAFMIPIVHYIILMLGILDIGFDYRKRFKKKE